MKSMFSRICAIFLIATSAALALPSPAFAGTSADDCVRGEPIPVFDASNPGLRSYRLLKSRDYGLREFARLGRDESLEIRQGGCEYVVTTFRIQSKRLRQHDIAGTNAYLVAANLLRRLGKLNAQTPFDLVLAAGTLEAAVRLRKTGGFEQPFPVEGDGIDFLQTQVQINSAGMRAGAGVVEFSLFKGPL